MMSNKKKDNKQNKNSTLNDYHQMRSKRSCEAVKQMMKHPPSFEEMKEQIQKNLYQ